MTAAAPAQPAPQAAPGPMPSGPMPSGPMLSGPMSVPRALSFCLASLLFAVTQGLGMNLVSANLPAVQGDFAVTMTEATWLTAAYMAPNVSLALILVKFRTQYGLRLFADLSIGVFALVSLAHLLTRDFKAALLVRFLAGIAASPLSALAILYMLEPFSPARKLTVGLPLALAGLQLGMPLARVLSPYLLDIGQWHGLYEVEIALALLCLAVVNLVRLTPIPRAKVFEALDFVTYPLIATGFGLMAVVLTMGRLYWWFEAPWIGVCLAAAAGCVTLAVVIELNRERPFIDIRWLASRDMLVFAGALLTFRILLTEQTAGAAGFFQTLGLTNDQTTVLFTAVLAATTAGFVATALVLKPGREPALHLTALVLIAAGAFLDSRATNLTRPENLVLSQSMIAFAGSLFLASAMQAGMRRALARGPQYILSFIVVFLSTQSLGGLLGSALLGTFVTVREKFHSHELVQQVTLTDPVDTLRIGQLGHVYDGVLGDSALRNAEGVALLSRQVTREANVLAYNDLFLLTAVLALLAMLGLLIHLALGRLAASRAPEVPNA